MPNNIKNRIKLIGSDQDIQELINTMSTYIEPTEYISHDKNRRYKDSEGNIGWLNLDSNEFMVRREVVGLGVPKGFEIYYDGDWTRFPDFEKIVPKPDGFKEVESNSFNNALENPYSKNDLFKETVDKIKKYCQNKSESEKQHILSNFLDSIENYVRFGFATWYSWNRENWGTKWNSYSNKKISDNEFEFETAWRGVEDLIRRLSEMFPNVTIEYKYADEDSGCNVGIGTFKRGVGEITNFENLSKEAYDLYFELNPNEKEYYEWVDDNYKYVNEDNDND